MAEEAEAASCTPENVSSLVKRTLFEAELQSGSLRKVKPHIGSDAAGITAKAPVRQPRRPNYLRWLAVMHGREIIFRNLGFRWRKVTFRWSNFGRLSCNFKASVYKIRHERKESPDERQ